LHTNLLPTTKYNESTSWVTVDAHPLAPATAALAARAITALTNKSTWHAL